MKKISAIVVLLLLLSTNIYANEIDLTCDNNRVMGYYKSGGISDEPGGHDELDTTFKINAKKKEFMNSIKLLMTLLKKKTLNGARHKLNG